MSPRMLRNERGFTLVELLVVVIVLSLLVAIVGPNLIKYIGTGKSGAARAQIATLEAALDAFRLEVGRYPSTSEGLQALVQSPGNVPRWSGPYLKKGKSVPKDPWGNAYKYQCCPGQHGDYDLWSEGADGAPGGEGENADVTSWEAEQTK